MKMKQCDICPRNCLIAEGETGFCGARANNGSEIICESYGRLTSMALDPIEKKPLNRFKPGSNILSVGSYGCNLSCGFCQNHRISMSKGTDLAITQVTPDELVKNAVHLISSGNMGLAYTYNEPMIGYEFVKDCCELTHKAGLNNIIVSNGYINKAPLEKILPLIDVANIDLKSFSRSFYDKIGGDLERVKESIKLYSENCHLEITCLIIPNENDDPEMIREMCKWLSSIRRDIPLHLSRFFPAYKYSDRTATSKKEIDDLCGIAEKYLDHVYKGNY